MSWVDIAKIALEAIALIMSLAAMALTLIRTRRGAVDERFREGEVRFKTGSDRMDRHENRLLLVEQKITDLPGKDDLHQLELAVAGIKGDLSEIGAHLAANRESMAGLVASTRRVEDYLLKKADP